VRLAYFVHDLSDAAVARRVRMLRHTGADVVVIGFRRTETAPTEVAGAPVCDLGPTFDGRLLQRSAAVMRSSLGKRRYRDAVACAEVILARNLEMMVVAQAARRAYTRSARLAYECLDIHRTMLSDGPVGALLRGLERSLLRRTDLVLVSSPAHLSEYFEPRQRLARGLGVPAILVENKMFACDSAVADRPRPQARPPWKIGWFGMLRCRQSLEILLDLARRHPRELQIVIAGRPSDREFRDFEAATAGTPNVTFRGPYRLEDLPSLYGDVHFNWAIDYFEEGVNSAWLLPNRLYEGGQHGAVPIALRSTECGRWLRRRGLGVLVDDPRADLAEMIARLDAESFSDLQRPSNRAPREWFVADRSDCDRLLSALATGPSPCESRAQPTSVPSPSCRA
jgi:glycosyltransferase involved in cell wall biosynthesis